jgi:uncharacterized protein YecE (DUF72 family)
MKQVYLGAMGWSYNFWPFYQKASSTEYLQIYSNHFNSVEINSTFYRIPRKSSVEKWRDQTPDDFVFSIKIPRSISHRTNLDYDPEKMDAFLDHIKPFGKKLGPILLQLPPRLSPEHSEQLETLLKQLKNHRVAVEFRHKDWFNETIYEILRTYNTTLVNGKNQSSKPIETSDFSYIRLEGDRRTVNGEKGLIEIDRSLENEILAKKIHTYQKSVYLYISKYYSGYPPSDIKQIKSTLVTFKKT